MINIILFLSCIILTSCSLFRPQQQFEMDVLADQVFKDGKGKGINIIVQPIEASKQ